MILTQEYSRVAAGQGERAWLISPQGRVIPCGAYHSHEEYVERHPEEFEGEVEEPLSIDALEKVGWIRVGLLIDIISMESYHRLTEGKLNSLKNFAAKAPFPYKWVEFHLVEMERVVSFSKEEFPLVSLKDVNRRGAGVGRYHSKRASLPDSRNMLKDYSLKDLYEPLRDAFVLMGLDRDSKYRKMSLPQITKEMHRREKMLQDETGWNSDDLITELNRFLADHHKTL